MSTASMRIVAVLKFTTTVWVAFVYNNTAVRNKNTGNFLLSLRKLTIST